MFWLHFPLMDKQLQLFQPLKCLKLSRAGFISQSSYRDKGIYIQPPGSREDPCFPSDLVLILFSEYEYHLLHGSFGFVTTKISFTQQKGMPSVWYWVQF